MSPSYELARLKINDKLTVSMEKKLPPDFVAVIETFNKVGDIREISFRRWWETHGKELFGRDQLPTARLINEEICSPKNKKSAKASGATKSKDELLIAVPISLSYSVAVDQVLELLAAQKKNFSSSKSQRSLQTKITVVNDRIHEEKLMKGLFLVQLRAEFPDTDLWQLGTEARISDAYADELRPAKNLKRPIDTVLYEKTIMNKLASRALKSHEAIIENAARGQFPNDTPLSYKFNYAVLRDILEYYEG